MPVDMTVRLGQVELPNLVLTASGCAGAGRELAQFIDVARVGAINRRVFGEKGHVAVGELRAYFDGREPEVNGEPFPLPRRERRILEFLLRRRGRRVSKTQIFNAVYGLFDENVDENVIESHISKLRKKLKHRLGFDPIDSKRFLGYCIEK